MWNHFFNPSWTAHTKTNNKYITLNKSHAFHTWNKFMCSHVFICCVPRTRYHSPHTFHSIYQVLWLWLFARVGKFAASLFCAYFIFSFLFFVFIVYFHGFINNIIHCLNICIIDESFNGFTLHVWCYVRVMLRHLSVHVSQYGLCHADWNAVICH